MANKNRGRGTPRGDFRGGRGGRGRGGFRGGGTRGGSPQPTFGPGRGRGRGRGGYHSLSEMGDVYLMAEDHQQQAYSGTSTPRGRGSRGGYNSNRGSGRQTPSRGGFRGRGRGIVDDFLSPFKRGRGGIGDYSPRGRGRFQGDKLRSDATLSDLLHQERPLLRPVIFVRSTLTATLFQEEEDILQATVEEIGDDEKSHVPTADRVFRLFSAGAGNIPPISDSEGEEQLEEIDFNETEKLLEPTTSTSEPKKNKDVEIIEEQFTGIYINRDSPPSTNIVEQESMTISEGGATTISSSTLVLEATGVAPHAQPVESSMAEEPMNVDPVQERPQPGPSTSTTRSTGASASAPTEEGAGFYIDTEPTKIENLPPPPVISSDDEEIVYVAPHPRSERDTPAAQPSPAPQVSALPTTSIITGTTITSTAIVEETEPAPQAGPSSVAPAVVPTPPSFSSVSFSFQPTPQRPRQIPVFTAGSRSKAAVKQRQRDARAAKTKAGRKAFGMFGGMMAEAQLQEELEGRDPKWEERRRGDSDIDWGDEDEGGKGGANVGLEGDAEGMLVDEDIDIEAMKMFVKGMNPEGSTFVTMDDIADQEMMRKEDEEGGENGGQGSSAEEDDEEDKEGAQSDDEESEDEGDVDAVVNAEEELMIAEEAVFDGLMDNDEEEDEEDSDDDIGLSPGASFQARLERLREQSRKTPSKSSKKGKGKARMEVYDFSDEDDDEEFLHNLSWAEQDEEFMAHIQDVLDENEAVLTGRDRKARKQLFNAIRDGDFDDMDDFKPARKKKDKYKDLPSELQAQWKKDREKKAEYKRARELAKLEAAADPLVKKKGGKKGRKAMLAAAMADPTIVVLPNRVIDMTTLVQQIRRFVADIDGPQSMPLPPTDKQTRKAIHEMAIAFNLNSRSEGKGTSRYTTLKKTSRSHLPPNERKIGSIVKRYGRGGGEFISGAEWASKRGDRPPKHKEGDEVGKHAPKIGEANIGFKMLSLMGWSEGDKIGVSGGLEAPITALFKTSKLGLGATR